MDKNTAEKLYEAFYMKVFSYVMTLTKDRNDAEEITQETFFRAISTDKASGYKQRDRGEAHRQGPITEDPLNTPPVGGTVQGSVPTTNIR